MIELCSFVLKLFPKLKAADAVWGHTGLQWDKIGDHDRGVGPISVFARMKNISRPMNGNQSRPGRGTRHNLPTSLKASSFAKASEDRECQRLNSEKRMEANERERDRLPIAEEAPGSPSGANWPK
jgi:hypothetical protein